MWGASEEPPGTVEGEPSETVTHAKEKCEQNKSQLESLKEVMLKNKQSLKQKEEEVQEYARRLSKIKSRAKLSRRSKEGNSSPKDTTQVPKTDAALTGKVEETIDDISQAKTPKAKSTLLQKKLAENRKVFERRSKEMTETKRAVEEKVEAIRQQLEEKDTAIMGMQKDQSSVTPIMPIVVTSDIMSPIQIEDMQEKENKIKELANKILDLEATVLDLQENLKEKDSVIESKTLAVTLMSADLSKKGKTTLDTLEDTKDEMRTMQEHFVLLETSLKSKNDSLLNQLEERDNRVTELEGTIKQLEQQMDEQKRSESASIDFSRSTMDTLAETKDAMKSMQENFVLIESSLKAKNDHLLQQLSDYELKYAEANERIFQLESGIGIVKDPKVDDLLFKLEKLEQGNKRLQDEKYELQKSIADMQDRIVNAPVHGNGAIMEKDNRIAELESFVEELKQSNKLLEEESKTELQKQLADVTVENEQFSNKINDLEKLVHQLEAEKSDIAAKLTNESATAKEEDKVARLTKELEDLNKTMIKMKAQHRSKVKNLQKQLENFKMVSDANAELVRLGNQVALLEEEKGNLQLSLVDFDELKASAGDWQERIADLETKVSAQTKEIEMHIEAIATLESQKLDLTQELHTAKQEISALETENAESENLRVTAEMKVVDLEEQLEATHKAQDESNLESSPETNSAELLKRIEVLTQENSDLYNKITKMKEKGTSDTGSTESFEAIQESDKSDLLKKIEDLTQKNNELTLKLSKFEEKGNSHAGSTESFESINDTDKHELLKKIGQLTQENSDLTTKLSRMEEKGSSDAGSTESFERIPEHSENMTKLELLTQEHNELVIKLTKLEEYIKYMESSRIDPSSLDSETKIQSETLLEESNDRSLELTKFKAQVMDLTEENNSLQKRIDDLTVENNDMFNTRAKLEDRIRQLEAEVRFVRSYVRVTNANVTSDRSKRDADTKDQFADSTEEESLKSKIEELLEENNRVLTQVSQLEEFNERLKENLNEVSREKEELHFKIEQMMSDNSAKERLELIDKLERLNEEKESVAHERQELHEEISSLLHKSNDELSESRKSDESTSQQVESKIVADLEREIEDCKKIIGEQTSFIDEMKIKFANKERELEEKGKLIAEYEASGKKAESLEAELKEMMQTIEDMGYKCNEMQDKMQALEAGKASIEEGFKMLQRENEILLEERKEKDTAADLLKQQLETTITSLELKLEEGYTEVSAKDEEIVNLKDIIRTKDEELNAKYVQLQNEMIAIDSLQDELNNSRSQIQEKDSALTTVREEIANLNNAIKNKEEEIYALRKDITELSDKLQESKPIEVYNELATKLMDKDMALNEIESKMNIIMQENDDLLQKVQNLSQSNEHVRNQLSEKEQKLTDLTATNEHLESGIWELQNIMDNNAKFVDALQTELKNAYKQTEQLKLKHTEDIEMQNQRLENLLGDLNARNEEFEVLKAELREKERLLEEKESLLEEKEKQLGQSVTEEVKVSLENKIADLERQLADSEGKIQAQLEKMKKIAATLKKKTALCQELETRVVELEEKWTTEKDEKEAKNKRIQEVESAMREKDNKIADLEDKLIQARNETAEALKNMDNLKNDLSNSKEEMVVLVRQITEMEEEIVHLRADIESLTSRLTAEKEVKENISAEYESYKQEVIRDNERKQLELEEVKERARELSVRMQVMETEYVEQLALIKNLHAENGLLLSKQTQINEKLENAEREAEERRLFVEQLQKVIASTTTATTQTSEEDFTEEDTKATTAQYCDQCERYQLLVQALEQNVQEQKAEIENLDKELGNSIGNAMLRFNNYTDQPVQRNSDLVEPYASFLLENNSLLATHEELKAKLSDALKENKELADKIEELQSANITLDDNISLTNRTLEEMAEKVERLERVDLLNVDLSRKCEDKETELLNMQKEVQDAQNRADQLQQELKSQLTLFENEKQQLVEKEKLLMNARGGLEQEVESLKVAQNSSQKRIEELESELELHNKQSIEPVKESTIVKRETSIFDRPSDEQGNAPQLFDASKIFGTSFAPESDILGNKEVSRLKNLLQEKEVQCSNLTQVIEHMQTLMAEERSQMLQNYSQCTEKWKVSQENLYKTRSDVERLEHHLAEKDRENAHLNNVSLQMIAQQDQQNIMTNELKNEISIKDGQIKELIEELNSTRETLDRAIVERDQQYQQLDTYKLQISNLEAELKNSTDPELIRELERHISNTTKERDLLQLQVNDLSRSMEELKDSIEVGRSLQADIEKVQRERDEAKELVANLTQALEEYHKNSVDKGQATVGAPVNESVALTESDISSKPIEQEENIEKATHLEIGSTWDAGSSEKLNVDEESWGWNPDDAVSDQHVPVSLVPSTEIQLRAKIDDLQDRIKDLEAEKLKILEENKNAQVRSGKMIKKLKEYKVQLDNLQQQVKLQKSASDFYQLDSAIEEELKTQINKLEKTLSEVRDEQKNTVAEKEALANRLDVVVSANERYMELKERQDMEMEVLRIRNKELSEKIEALDRRLQESVMNLTGQGSSQVDTQENVSFERVSKMTQDQLQQTSSTEDEDFEALSKKYKDEIEDLKKELEAFDAENKELRDMLEKQNSEMHELNASISQLKVMLTESNEKYSQCVMNASEQMVEMQLKVDREREEAVCEMKKLELEINDLRDQAEASDSKMIELRNNLEVVFKEKAELKEKMIDKTATMDKEVSNLKESLLEVTDLLNARIQEVQNLKSKLSKMKEDHDDSMITNMQAYKELMDEVHEFRNEYDKLWESISDKERASIEQRRIESLIPLINDDNRELVRALVMEITENETMIRNAAKKMSQMQTTLNDTYEEMKKYSDKIAALEQELEHARNIISEKDNPVKTAQSELPFAKEGTFAKQFEVSQPEKNSGHFGSDSQKYFENFGDLSRHFVDSETALIPVDEYKARIKSLEEELEIVKGALTAKTSSLDSCVKQCEEYKTDLEKHEHKVAQLRAELKETDDSKKKLEQEIEYISSTLQAKGETLEETKRKLTFNTSLLESAKETLIRMYKELNELRAMNNQPPDSDTIDDLPFFKIVSDCETLQSTIDSMQSELDEKKIEMEHLKFLLNKNTYPAIIEDMQGRINCLHNEKAELESFLEASEKKYIEAMKQLHNLEERIEEQDMELLSREVIIQGSREGRSRVQDQEEIVRLRTELYEKESEIKDLVFSLRENDFNIKIQAGLSSHVQFREMIKKLSTDLFAKEQEIKQLNSTIEELEKEISNLRNFCEDSQISSERNDEAMRKLVIVEQEGAKTEEILKEQLREKEMEIDNIKQRLTDANHKILYELQLREKDIENLKQQLESSSIMAQGITSKLRQKEEELFQVNANLAEKGRRLAENERILTEYERTSAENERILAENGRIVAENERIVAELSVKDAELHNLTVQIRDKDARIEELMRLSQEEEQQLTELRNTLEARETEINALKKLLEEKLKEYELMQNALKRDVPVVDTSASSSSEASVTEGRESISQELDLALYMLHQRDVRCEELTHELMQLLEERDTLQLRLSNAIRINEELRRAAGSDVTPSPNPEAPSTSGTQEPLVEHPSPSKSEGPVEIAKEAIDAPIGEDKDALAVKLSQLHTVSHAKDVRLRDERELRHTQQMSLLSHKDVLSTLPPEAAARLVNANYTLSRDVQSQSSVLLNWLWGKSTPKVVHM